MSVWLVPDAPAWDVLDTLVLATSRRLGTPRFSPHLTLVGGVGHGPEVVAGAAELAHGTPALDLRLVRSVHRAEHFRAVVLETEPSEPLSELHARAMRALPGDTRPFEPHVSIAYGEVPEAGRAAVAAELAARLPLPVRVSRLEVWSTEGEPEEWARLAAFPLRGGR